MKKVFITIMLILSLTAIAQTHYGSRVKYIIRKSTVHNRTPNTSAFNYTNSWAWNTTDSIIYTKVGSVIAPKYKLYLYKSQQYSTIALTGTSAGSYSNTIYPYYIRTSSIAGNVPPLSDFTYSNTWCWNTKDNKIYTKVKGVVTATYSIYNYVLSPIPPITPDCIFTYGDWTECLPNGTQSRVLISAVPEGCVGTPVLSRTCTYIPPVIPPTYETAKWWLSPTGSDSNIGDSANPFLSLNKVWTKVVAGDLVYMRGGTYAYNSTQLLSNKIGSTENLIKVWAYPGELPIITPGASYTGTRGINIQSANYIHIKGLEIKNFQQRDGTTYYFGIVAENCNNNIYELLNVHDNGFGISIGGNSNGNLILNSDFWNNSDPLSDPNYLGVNGQPWGGADGITIRVVNAATTNTMRGCRMWWNSDDGVDLFNNNGTIIIDNCWAFWNGYKPSSFITAGDGNGFKLGSPEQTDQSTVLKRIITNNLTFENRMRGFEQNQAKVIMHLYNNTSYHNGARSYDFFNTTAAHVIKNNIAFADVSIPTFNPQAIVSYNTFLLSGANNGSYSVSNADFISVSSAGMNGPRQSDGSLPVLNFLRLATGSDLINTGVNVGLPYNGSDPDLGCYEY